jgi:RNA polymerase sigma factor (sigma-70 family)
MAINETAHNIRVPQPELAYDLEGVEDPLLLAAQALVKLRAAGHSGVLEPRDQEQEGPLAEVIELHPSAEIEEAPSRSLRPDDFRDAAGHLTGEQRGLYSKYFHLPELIAKRLGYKWNVSVAELEECIGSGYEGLVKAVRGFDKDKLSPHPNSEVAFIYKTIQGEIKRKYRDRNYRSRNPESDDDIIPKLGVISGSADSLYKPIGDDDGMTLLDVFDAKGEDFEGEAQRLRAKELVPRILERLDTYPERERQILLRTLVGYSQKEIATVVGLSQMHTGRILRGMIDKLLEELELKDEYKSKRAPMLRPNGAAPSTKLNNQPSQG